MNVKKNTIIKNTVLIFCVFLLALLPACSYASKTSVRNEFLKLFDLQEYKKIITVNELFDNYEGFPYEGVALYEIVITDQPDTFLEDWSDLPLASDAASFLESISDFVSIPVYEHGKYKMISRSENPDFMTNASLFIFDKDSGKGCYIKFDM